MISHKHKCIFVHIPKAAGSSVEHLFLNDLDITYKNRKPLWLGVNNNRSIGPPHFAHLTVKEYIEHQYISKELYDEYFTFGIVRNPYDRIYSTYKYFCYNYFISFNRFVRYYLDKNAQSAKMRYFYKPMYDYLYLDKELAVDYVGKLESLDEDMKLVMSRTNIALKTLPHVNKSSKMGFRIKMRRIFDILRQHPQIIFHYNCFSKNKKKEYNAEMKKVVKNIYSQDFESFNYEY